MKAVIRCLKAVCWWCLMTVHDFFASIGRYVKQPAYPFENMERYRKEYQKLEAENDSRERQELGRLLQKPKEQRRFDAVHPMGSAPEESDSGSDDDDDPLHVCMEACNMFGALNMEYTNGFMGMNHWKVKYFILQGPYLLYWNDQDDDMFAGHYHLSLVHRVVEFEDEPCMFAIEWKEDGSRQLYEALDEMERDRWVESMTKLLKRMRREPDCHELRLAKDNFDLYATMAGVAKRILNPPNRETGGFS